MSEEAYNEQDRFQKYINKTRIGNKSKKQRKALANLNMLFNRRNNIIRFWVDYSSMILEAKKPNEEKSIKICTPKQMFQRLPTALV